MATLAESLNSSTARALAVKKRPDLVVEKTRYQGQLYYVVKDPLALTYFRFQEEEFEILQMLDGRTSMDELKRRFEKQFAPQKITLEELGRLVGMLHRSHLVIADLPGQGHQLRLRNSERVKKEWLGKLANLLAIRFKGIDPERMLTRLLPWFGWLFTWVGGVVVFGIAAAALLLVLVQFDRFQAKLPTFHEFFAAENWIYLGVTMGVCKILHEFGHGLSCKKFGGECHEMGLMLLVFTPCLYCNVSDSWMLPNKWRRAMIGAAGMYVELLIAGLATFGWWFSQPGLFNFLCLSTIFVCSVSTLLFNANPLMRYDGYYILSDLLEIPNLRQKATSILGRKLGKWCLGLKEHEDPFLPRRHQLLFAVYSIAATAYMWLVSVSILFFLYHVFEGNGLRVLGHLLAAAALVNLLVVPLWRVVKFFIQPGRAEQVKTGRLLLSLSILTVLLAAFILVPLPYRVFTPAEITLHQGASVYVDVPGHLVQVYDYVKPGKTVARHTPLAILRNDQLELEINQLERRVAEKEMLLYTAKKERAAGDPQAANEVEPLQRQLTAAENELAAKIRDRERLILKAPAAGTIIAPPEHVDRSAGTDEILPQWSGNPLSEENLGALLTRDTLFCQIGDPRDLIAMLIVTQQEIDFIRAGQKVEIKFESLPNEIFTAQLEQVSPERLTSTSKQMTLKAGGEIETKTDPQGREVPINTVYQARVRLRDETGRLIVGMRGQARIHVAPQSLGQRTWRMLVETFNFSL